MARQPSPLTKEIQYAIKEGMTNKEIAELLSCTRAKVASVRHRSKAKAKAKAKQREYNARYKARQKAKSTEVTDHEINALRAVPNVRTQVTMEGPVKYTWWERVRIFFRGW